MAKNYICKKIKKGVYYFQVSDEKYTITNHGYYPPDKCIWWEAINMKTNEADFHEKTKGVLIRVMIKELIFNQSK